MFIYIFRWHLHANCGRNFGRTGLVLGSTWKYANSSICFWHGIKQGTQFDISKVLKVHCKFKLVVHLQTLRYLNMCIFTLKGKWVSLHEKLGRTKLEILESHLFIINELDMWRYKYEVLIYVVSSQLYI